LRYRIATELAELSKRNSMRYEEENVINIAV